jgi:hypothetical protein
MIKEFVSAVWCCFWFCFRLNLFQIESVTEFMVYKFLISLYEKYFEDFNSKLLILFMLMLVFSFLVLSTFLFVCGKINLSMLWMNWCWSTNILEESYRWSITIMMGVIFAVPIYNLKQVFFSDPTQVFQKLLNDSFCQFYFVALKIKTNILVALFISFHLCFKFRRLIVASNAILIHR